MNKNASSGNTRLGQPWRPLSWRQSLGSISSCLLSVLFAATAQAAHMDCLEQSKGQVLEWRDAWANPPADHGKQYSIQSVAIRDKIPDRSVTLELSALGPSRVSRRTLVVTTEEKARVVCESFVKVQPVFRLPENNKEQERMSKYRFIEHTHYGWVRGQPKPEEVLTICKIGELEFSCRQEEKTKFSTQLILIQEELANASK